MNFLVLIFVFLAHRFLAISQLRRRINVFQFYADKMSSRLVGKAYFHGWMGLVALLFPALIIMLILMLIAVDTVHGSFLPLLNVLVLFVSLIECDYHTELDFSQQVTKSLNAFTLLVWFIFLGAFGVVLAKLLQLASNQESPIREVASKLYFYYAWLPAKLLAISFACVSHFSDVLGHCLSNYKMAGNDAFLMQSASIALNDKCDVERVTWLMDRCLLLWAAVLAVIILA